MGDVKKVIYFELLGSFTYRNAGDAQQKSRAVPDKTGRKILSFLQYLVVNHARNISSEELIEQFWTEKSSSDPANALKNTLFKARNILKAMFPDQEGLILTFPGYYAWNPSVRLELDCEQFEQMCLEARTDRKSVV